MVVPREGMHVQSTFYPHKRRWNFFLIALKLTETTAVFLFVTFSQMSSNKTQRMTYFQTNFVKTDKITFNVHDKTLKSTKS